MNKTINIASILIRFLGLCFVLIGVICLLFIALAVIVALGGGGKWVIDYVMPYAAPMFFSGPLYFLSGLLVLKFSPALANFISKNCKNDIP